MRNRLSEFLPGNDKVKTDIVIERDLLGTADALLTRIGFAGKRLLIVCDVATHAAAAERLAHELADFAPKLLTLSGKLHADEPTLQRIQNHNYDALVAVGSGTINDLCKFASFLEGKPYAVFPTAPSMNGYLSANASITFNKIKQTHAAHLPAGVFCDLSVLAAAPARLLRAGLGDSLCRPTAQADWLMSHLLLDTPYSAQPFELLKPFEGDLFARADKLAQGDVKAVELLMCTLAASGLGMTIANGSYPASQGEHLIAHTMEMKHGDMLAETFHGEQIGVATLTMAKIQHEALSRPLQLPPRPRCEEALASYLGTARAQRIAESACRKYDFYDRQDAITSRMADREHLIRDAVRAVTLPESFLREILMKAGAPTTPVELGWSEGDYDIAVSRARFTRDRFTFLDLL